MTKSEVVDLDQAVIFVYPDSTALKAEYEAQKSDNVNEKHFMQQKLKSIWAEIQAAMNSLAASEYFWHDEGIHWEVIDRTVSPFNSFFHGTLRFGDGMEDEWFTVKFLRALTASNPSLVAAVFDTDGDFILIEASEVLPEWLEPETSKNRIFIHKGQVKIVPVEQFKAEPTLQEALKFIRSPACPSQERIDQIIRMKCEEPQKLHRTRVRVPLSVARILKSKAELVGPAVSAFYNREPESMRICTQMPRFNPGQTGGPLVLTTIPMTRIQFAQLACQEFVAPQNESVNFQLSSCENPVAAELGMKLTCGFEILMSSEEKFIHKSPFEQVQSCQQVIEDILREPCSEESVVNDDPEDSLAWMEISEEFLESELQGRFDNLSMDEKEKSSLIDTWTEEFESGRSKVGGMKEELTEIDEIVEKMKKMIESTSNFDGIEDNEKDSDYSDSETESDFECSDSENDEKLLEREIFETISYDPDLLMKILEANAHMEVSSEEFLQRFRKYQQDNPNQANKSAGKQKGIADIDEEKVAEARKSSRKVFDEVIVNDEKEEEECVDEKEPVENETIETVDHYSSEEEDDEFIYGQTLEQLKKSSKFNTTEICADFDEYFDAMDRQLQAQLAKSEIISDENENLGKNLIESMAAGRGGSGVNPIETIVSGLGKKIPRPS